jgi:hypothetical protein
MNMAKAQVKSPTRARTAPTFKRVGVVLLSLLGLLLCLAGGAKTRRIYLLAQEIRSNVYELRDMAVSSPRIEDLGKVGPRLEALQQNLGTLRQETKPFLWLGPLLDWVPVYGGDLAAASDLLDLAENITSSANEMFQAAQPGLEYLQSDKAMDLSQFTRLMLEAQPRLAVARDTFDKALVARGKIDAQRLSPDLRMLLVEDLDPILALADDGLSLAASLPSLMGATSAGQKTYLLLIQNEDELRPTGGFIGAVGTLIVKDGKVVSLTFEDSYAFDDWSKPYPAAPWQLRHYMDVPVLTLHDANWFTDYPTTALYAEYLYTLSRSDPVDGVIALDQHVVVLALEAIGPLEVEDAPYPLTADNVIAYMRLSKIPPPLEERPPNWHRKAFINEIAEAIMKRVLKKGDVQWNALLTALVRALDEKHVLLHFDDPAVDRVIARRGWNGAVIPEHGDFLMLVDTNVGYTKSNAILATNLLYELDLTDLSAPKGTLTVTQTNQAPAHVACLAGGQMQGSTAEQTYPIELCYWGYLRVYKTPGTKLEASTPHTVAAAYMPLERTVPARVDRLTNYEPEHARVFGTLVLVPAGRSVSTRFEFRLPASVLLPVPDSKHILYKLKVQKQPGTQAVPLTLQIELPVNATVTVAPNGVIQQGNHLSLITDLRKDVNVELIFMLP